MHAEKTVRSAEELRRLVSALPADTCWRLRCEGDLESIFGAVRDEIRAGRIEAVFTIFNGRRDEFWRVSQANIAGDGFGAPIAIFSPGKMVAVDQYKGLV